MDVVLFYPRKVFLDGMLDGVGVCCGKVGKMTGMPVWLRIILVVLGIGAMFIGVVLVIGWELWRDFWKDWKGNKL